jgi:hypothetical protein
MLSFIINPLRRARGGQKQDKKRKKDKCNSVKTHMERKEKQCSANPNNKGDRVMPSVVPVPLYEMKHHSS